MNHFFFCSKTCWVENATKWEQKHPVVGGKKLPFVCRKCVFVLCWFTGTSVVLRFCEICISAFPVSLFFLSWKIIWQLCKVGLCSVRAYDSALLNNKMMWVFFLSALYASTRCSLTEQMTPKRSFDVSSVGWPRFCRALVWHFKLKADEKPRNGFSLQGLFPQRCLSKLLRRHLVAMMYKQWKANRAA